MWKRSTRFLIAFSVGVPVARWAVRHGLNSNRAARMDDEFMSGVLAPDTHLSAGEQVTHPANVDSLGWHLAILGVAYLLTDAYLGVMQPLAARVQLGDVHLSLIFSHNLFFFHGLIICVLLRAAMDRDGALRVGASSAHRLHREGRRPARVAFLESGARAFERCVRG